MRSSGASRLPKLTGTMKPRDRAAPDAAPPAERARPVTQEMLPDDTDLDPVDLDIADLAEPPSGPPTRVSSTHALQTAEIDFQRDRRVTLTSMIPTQIAAQIAAQVMAAKRDQDAKRASVPPPLPRDPAAPEPDPVPARISEAEQHTRRVGDSDRQRLGPGSGSGSGKVGEPDGVARRRQRAAALIDRARAALDEGDLTTAVDAAEGALREADEAPPPGIVEVIEPARPLLTRVFAAYVGSLSEVPVLAPRAADIARERLGERERALIGRIDGLRTLEELFDGSGLGSTDALRIAARLIRTGAIRVI